MEISSEVKGIYGAIKNGTSLFTNPFDGLVSSVSSLVPGAASNVSDVIASAKNAVSKGFLTQTQADQIVSSCPVDMKNLGSVGDAKSVLGGLAVHAAFQIANVEDNMGMVTSANQLAEGFGESTSLCQKFHACMGSISGSLDSSVSTAQQMMADASAAVSDALSAVSPAISNTFNTVSASIKTWMDGLSGPATTTEFSTMLSDFANGVTDYYNDFKAKAGETWSSIQTKLSEVSAKITEISDKIQTAITQEIEELSGLANEMMAKAKALQLPSFLNDPCAKMVISKAASPEIKSILKLS